MSHLHPLNKIRQAFFVCALGLAALMLAACGGSKAKTVENANEAASAEPQPMEVAAVEAVSQEIAAYLQATGSFIADETSDIAPEISGQVVATPVDIGSFVKQGAVIARLDDRDARLRLQQAQAAQRQAEAALMQAQQRLGLDRSGNFDVNAVAEVRSARLAYESAEAEAKLAETNARRYERLVETGDVSRAVYDQARTQADTARAQANAARQQLEVAINQARLNNTGIAAAQAAVEAARTQTGLAQKALADTVITAPYSGYISDRPAAVGEYVNTQSKIATLLRTNPIKLRLQLPEADAGKVRPGMSVTANVTAFPGKEFSGKVTMINPAIDPASRTITVEAEIQNPANELRPNMFATARINQPEGVTAVLVPRSAVILDPATNSQRVYVIEGDNKSDTIARLRVVQTGEQDGDRVRIVTGVNAGEAVAISNLDQLYDGAKVRRQ